MSRLVPDCGTGVTDTAEPAKEILFVILFQYADEIVQALHVVGKSIQIRFVMGNTLAETLGIF
jgi:hypothetical protein